MRYGADNPNWKGGNVTKVCQHCGSEFSVCRARESIAKYCSKKCLAIEAGIKGRAVRAAKATYHWRKSSPIKERRAIETKARLFRNKDFVHPYTRLGFAKKCGHLTRKNLVWCPSCNPTKAKSRDRVCVICGTAFQVPYPSMTLKTCSPECARRHRSDKQRGEKSHRWEGGKTDANKLLRNGLDATMWREQVFARDDYTCVKCGQRGGRLTADHIKPWALYPALRFDVDNGRTLCRTCHADEPTTGVKLVRLINAERKHYGGVQLRLL